MYDFLLALKILFPEYIALFLSICISKTIWELLATQHGERIGWRWVNLALAGAAVVVILRFSVLGRNGSDVHRFIWIEKSEPWECIPELYKNLALYYPLGLFLPFAMNRVPPSRRRAACASLALLLSVGIETWQYIHGAGMAQLSDVVMNTVGAVIGTSAYAKSLRFTDTEKTTSHLLCNK